MVKRFSGFGATEEDLERGFCKPEISNAPEYDKANYAWRATEFRVPDEDSEQGESLEANLKFQQKGRKTPGLFIRPRLPIER